MEQSLQYPIHGAVDLEAEAGFLFRQVRTREGYSFVTRAQWQTTDAELDLDRVLAQGEVLLAGSEAHGEHLGLHACVANSGAILHVILERRVGDRPGVRVAVAAPSMDAAEDQLAGVRELIPPVDPQAAYELPVSFWNQGQFGADRRERALEPLRWDAIAGNYPGGVGRSLATLAGSDAEAVGARLHLWHGPPGTGKTHAVRMLATAWREWCDLHYITDPEQFFASAEYMMDVVLGSSAGWRLVVLEDAGEFLGTDAPAAVGQGFSRLLNLTDGILGYGARTMLLLTTNQDLRTLHPATRRAGRAASHLTFATLAEDEARAWLDAQGVAAPIDGPRTLAELYALRDGSAPLQAGESARLGFA